ncbi:DUF6040 family protein [Coprococcus catus]|nr:DUF6040 family protein [Coprococcus catus]
MVALMSTAIVIYFGKWIKSVIPINLIIRRTVSIVSQLQRM